MSRGSTGQVRSHQVYVQELQTILLALLPISTPSSEMSTQTFRNFANLPYELRHQIWQMAIGPAGPGIHHFSIFESATNNSPLTHLALRDNEEHTHCFHKAAAPRVAGIRKMHSWMQGNPSSYLWDAGLWTACTESREIMLANFDIRHWSEIIREYRRESWRWNFYPGGEQHDDKPAMVVAPYNNEELHLMVNPHRDLFCLDPHDFGLTINWDSIFCDLPFSCMFKGYGPPKHIAVEFDPSWNVDFPRNLDDNWDPVTNPGVSFVALLKERTPRGFIARIVDDYAERVVDQDELPFFWLIDRGIQCRKTTSQCNAKDPRKEFYDCNHRYIETIPADVDFDDDMYEEYCQAAIHFVGELLYMPDSDSDVVRMFLGVLTCK